CTVLRDGKTVATHNSLVGIGRAQIVQEMVGREISDIYDYRARPIGRTRLEVNQVTGKKVVRPASFSVRSGEIVGFFGLVGAGRREPLGLISWVLWEQAAVNCCDLFLLPIVSDPARSSSMANQSASNIQLTRSGVG